MKGKETFVTMSFGVMLLVAIAASYAQVDPVATPITEATKETSVKDLAKWDDLTTNQTIVLPMPIDRTIKFALEGDEKGPGEVAINFPAVDVGETTRTCQALLKQITDDEATSITEGLGGDVSALSRRILYSQLLREQRQCLFRIQLEVNKLIQIRAKCAYLRSLEAEVVPIK
jgi:hypothetical protein